MNNVLYLQTNAPINLQISIHSYAATPQDYNPYSAKYLQTLRTINCFNSVSVWSSVGVLRCVPRHWERCLKKGIRVYKLLVFPKSLSEVFLIHPWMWLWQSHCLSKLLNNGNMEPVELLFSREGTTCWRSTVGTEASCHALSVSPWSSDQAQWDEITCRAVRGQSTCHAAFLLPLSQVHWVIH